jgi:uncharacterized membrane-anchored protein YitT (DUF2179 family)
MTMGVNVFKQKILPKLTDVAFLVASSLLYAISYNMFLVPGSIFVGGVGGIATVLNIKFGLPTGIIIIALNVPLIIGFIIAYGWRSSIKTIIGVLTTSVFVDVTAALKIFPAAFDPSDKILNALFGGITLGAALGVLFWRGITTGGTDIAALLLKTKIKRVSTSTLILICDGAVIVFAAIMMNDWLTVLYSFLAVFMMTSTLGFVTGGFDKGSLVYIFSEKTDEIAETISKTLDRGVTLLDGMGWYTKREQKIIMCAVKKNELYKIKFIAKTVDPRSFIIVSESDETIGEGFKTSLGEMGFEEKEKKKKP